MSLFVRILLSLKMRFDIKQNYVRMEYLSHGSTITHLNLIKQDTKIMTSILNNEAQLKVYPFTVGKDEIKEIVLLAGLNLNIDPKLVEFAKAHPIFNHDIKIGKIKIIETEVAVKGEKEGYLYSDDKKVGEETLVIDNELLNKIPTYRPEKETLLKYSGVGDSTADKILALMPKDGWKDKASFKADTAEFGIDWSPKGKKAAK
jgi:hypothetical protein